MSTFAMPRRPLQLLLAALLAGVAGGAAGATAAAATPTPTPPPAVAAPPAAAAPGAAHHAQEPQPPFPYGVREALYTSGAVHLAGTLSVPPGKGPFPAVLLISGSGAQDRDGEILGHRPFLVLADRLTRAGIAVLRVDDRGVGGSSGDNETATDDDLAGDVLAGVHFLAAQPEVAPGRIGLLGHSEGGVVAPLAASRSHDVAFLVLLAATALPGDVVLMHQTADLLRLAGTPSDLVDKRLAVERRLLDLVASEPSTALRRDLLRPLVRAGLQLAPAGELAASPADLDALVDATVRTMASPWYRSFVISDPEVALRRVHVPVLALWGERDVQVAAQENQTAMAHALRDAGEKDVTLRQLPGLNHLLQDAETGSPDEYATLEQTMSPEVMDIVAHWILDRFGGPPPPAAAAH
jgi:pimeloyl-ACP methyl ester carboxylesterase